MVQYFNINSLQRAPAAFNTEKLALLNQHYIKTLDKNLTAQALAHQLKIKNIAFEQGPLLTEMVSLLAERSKTLAEMADSCRCFFQAVTEYDQQALAKHLTPEIIPVILQVRQQLTVLKSWQIEAIHQVIYSIK